MKTICILFIAIFYLVACTVAKNKSVNQITYADTVRKYWAERDSVDLAPKFDFTGVDTIADIGSGLGYSTFFMTKYFPSHLKYINEDINDKLNSPRVHKYIFNALGLKYDKSRYKYIKGTEDHIPLQDNSVKLMTCFISIHEFSKKTEMLNEMKRVLNRSGSLYIYENVCEVPAKDLGCGIAHINYITLDSLLKNAGFAVENLNYINNKRDTTGLHWAITNKCNTVLLRCKPK